jgi:cobyrinic acid a,c-diamide synthase
MKAKIPRVMLAAFHSGGGKTTLTCAILKALVQKGINPAAFKCGPDYIDPMFHSEVIGVQSRNLDLFMLDEEVVKYLFAVNSKKAQIAVLEGVMGYYDGLGANSTVASSYHLASVTETPVVLVVNCKGSSLSLAALIKGFAEFKADSRIKGVILNNLSPGLYPIYQEMIEKEAGIAVIGYFPWIEDGTITSRHLGLITAAEIEDLQVKISVLARQASQTVNLSKLFEIAQEAPPMTYQEIEIETCADIRIAVAMDKAFCFYYADSLELLKKMGAQIIPFSPLADRNLPECDGLILGGGYPEVFAAELSENKVMLHSIQKAVNQGMPCIAECGGFMYLQQQLSDLNGNTYPMAGCIEGEAFMTGTLNRFGYIKLVAHRDNLLCQKGDVIYAHEFHYSDSTVKGDGFSAVKPASGKQWDCIYSEENLFAGYPHLHLWSNRKWANSFMMKCKKYNHTKNQG